MKIIRLNGTYGMTNLEVIWFRHFKAVFWLIPIEFPIVVVILRLVANVFAIWRQYWECKKELQGTPQHTRHEAHQITEVK